AVSNEYLYKAKVLQVEIFVALGLLDKANEAIHEAGNVSLVSDEIEALKEFSARLEQIKFEMKQN
ncbi:hypothetical protein NPX94_30085, partial [Bacillus wiedmannii]|nr:hypothetical protein [Bacillus wiedmannii]